MLERIRKSFNEGVKSIKWVAIFLAERLKAETSMAKLLYASSKLEAKVDELYRDIGKRVLELKEKDEKAVLKDPFILQAIDEIKRVRDEIDDYKTKAEALSKPQNMLG
ncbi:MAG: hypothetical protein HY752_07665 [Nitrospirae bacterium]|nr:hypothetical protein [Nitrospirota bacterium]